MYIHVINLFTFTELWKQVFHENMSLHQGKHENGPRKIKVACLSVLSLACLSTVTKCQHIMMGELYYTYANDMGVKPIFKRRDTKCLKSG